VRPNKIKQMWREKRCVTMGWLSVSNGFTAEVMARQGFDALCIDMQHGLTDMSDLWPMLQAVSQTDTVPVVRVPWNDPATIMKALDFGAYGIIVPLVSTAEEAAKAVAACRYPPVGMRSSGPLRAAHYGGANYQAEANGEMVVLAMIETKEGLANLDAICATPGLDAVYIGPADLSYALDMAPRGDNPDPVHLATCDRIRETARRNPPGREWRVPESCWLLPLVWIASNRRLASTRAAGILRVRTVARHRRGDLQAIAANLEAQAYEEAHVEVGEPHQREPGNQVAAPAVVEQRVSGHHQHRGGDPVAETVLAGEEIEGLARHEAPGGPAFRRAPLARLAKHLLVRHRPRDGRDRNRQDEQEHDLMAQCHGMRTKRPRSPRLPRRAAASCALLHSDK
jgi:4-hydroxy-2-oxoheptanedioate aldolase